MNYIYLDDLNKSKNGSIKWKESIGRSIKFSYHSIEGELFINNYIDNYVYTTFLGRELNPISAGHLKRCKLGGILGVITKNFKIEIGTHFKDDKRDMTITDREYREKELKPDKKGRIYTQSEKWYKYKCNKCVYEEGWTIEGELMNGSGCPCCSKPIKKIILGINTIWDTDRWMCGLGLSEEDAKKYNKSSRNKVNVCCPHCGNKKKIHIHSINSNKSISCICGDGFSYPEKFIANVINQLELSFLTQYSPEYMKRLENNKYSRKFSDFYLNDYNLVIEADGKIGHEGGNVYANSKKTIEEFVEIDKWKDEQHLKRGIKTIRINCFESDIDYIKDSILNSELSNLFDLSNIDWVKCEEFAISNNKVKEICKAWSDREDGATTVDIANIMNVCSATVLRYVKKGVKFNWCKYDVDDEKLNRGKKTGIIAKKNQTKKVEIFKNDISLGVFNSRTELSKISEDFLNIKLLADGISKCCKGKCDTYKGYKFRYINN